RPRRARHPERDRSAADPQLLLSLPQYAVLAPHLLAPARLLSVPRQGSPAILPRLPLPDEAPQPRLDDPVRDGRRLRLPAARRRARRRRLGAPGVAGD